MSDTLTTLREKVGALHADNERLTRERDDLAQEILDRSETCKGHTRSADRDRDEARGQRDDAMMRAEQAESRCAALEALLSEARTAMEPLTAVQIRLHRTDPLLASRIDAALAPDAPATPPGEETPR